MPHLNPGMAESTAGRIMSLLRRRPMTVDDLASSLGVSGNAIRPQLAVLERDGLVRQSGIRRGASKPARTYVLSREAEMLFSRAYVPVLTELLHVLATTLAPGEFNRLMRDVGRRLMADRPRPTGSRAATGGERERIAQRAGRARPGGKAEWGAGDPERWLPTGRGNPAASGGLQRSGEPAFRVAGLTVTNCCDRGEPLRCCFEIRRPV